MGAQIFVTPSFGPALMARGCFGTLRLAAAPHFTTRVFGYSAISPSLGGSPATDHEPSSPGIWHRPSRDRLKKPEINIANCTAVIPAH